MATSSSVPDIPGFYWDVNKKKYFKIPPGHLKLSADLQKFTKSGIANQQKETERQRKLAASKSTTGSECFENLKGAVPKNSVSFMRASELGMLHYGRKQYATSSSTTCTSYSSLLKRIASSGPLLNQRSTVDVFTGRNQYESREPPVCKFLTALNEEKTNNTLFFGIWQDSNGTSFSEICWPMRSKSFDGRSFVPTVRIQRYRTFSCAKVTGDYFLTICSFYPSNQPSSSSRLLYPQHTYQVSLWKHYGSPYRLGWTPVTLSENAIVFSAACNSRKTLLSVSSKNSIRLHDMETLRETESVKTGSTICTAQEFSQDGNVLFVGRRSKSICAWDGRSNSKLFEMFNQRATFWLQPVSKDQQLVAASYGSQLRLWDLRMATRPIIDFDHYENGGGLATRPLSIDSTETLLFGVRETDGETKCWDLHTVKLLCSIPSPVPVESQKDVPVVCFSRNLPVIILGCKNKLYSYPFEAY